MTRRVSPALLLLLVFGAAGCGKKGPPLAPLRTAPAAVTDLSARRMGDRVVLQFRLPEKSDDEPRGGRVELTRVEVYALSVAKPADAPSGEEFRRNAREIATIPLDRGPEGGGQKPEAGSPGPEEQQRSVEERVRTVYEVLDESASEFYTPKTPPAPSVPAVAPSVNEPDEEEEEEEVEEGEVKPGTTPVLPGAAPAGAPAAAPGAQPAAPAAAAPPVPMRVYMVVPVGRRNQRGPGAVARVPLVDPPAATAAPVLSYTPGAIAVKWEPVAQAATYNVYEMAQAPAAPPVAPINQTPLSGPSFEDGRVEFGRTRCYGVTAVREAGGLRVESELSPAACVTPADTFPPPVPGGLAAVAAAGGISLIWDPVDAGDLAGYLVLRGEAPGDTLQALTPEPISETTYRDAAVQPGRTYVYAVVAVDTAKNASAQSARVQETAR